MENHGVVRHCERSNVRRVRFPSFVARSERAFLPQSKTLLRVDAFFTSTSFKMRNCEKETNRVWSVRRARFSTTFFFFERSSDIVGWVYLRPSGSLEETLVSHLNVGILTTSISVSSRSGLEGKCAK